MVQFAGKYKQVKEENYGDFLKAIGMGMMMRKAATSSSPNVEISEASPGHWKMVTATKMKTVETAFESGKAFDEKTADGRDVSTTIVVDGNTWTMTQKNKKAGGPDATIVREFTDKGFLATFTSGKAVGKCHFERQ